MAKPLDKKEILAIQEIAVANLLQIEALTELLVEKGIMNKDELKAEARKFDKAVN